MKEYIVFILILLFVFSCGNKTNSKKEIVFKIDCDTIIGEFAYTKNHFFKCKNTNQFIADTDRKQLIYTILKRAVVENKDITDYCLIRDKRHIYVSNQNFKGITTLNRNEVPHQIENVQFCLKSQKELQEIANQTEHFLYLNITEIKISGSKAIVKIYNTWMANENNTVGFLSGGGYHLHFNKKNNKWFFNQNAKNLFIIY